METKNKKTLLNLFTLVAIMAIVVAVSWTKCSAQTDYMVKYGADGAETWFNIVGGDTTAIDGPPAHLVQNPLDIQGEAAQAQSLKDVKLPNGSPSLDWLFNEENGIFAGILTLLMYLSGFIPGLQNMPDKRKRAVALGVFLIAAVVIWRAFDSEVTLANFIGTLFTFFNVQLLYIFGLKPLGIETPDKKTAAA